MTYTVRLLACLALLLCLVPPPAQATEEPVTALPRHVDLVLCLDTSGSMSGLIHAAREKLWRVVEEMGHLKPMPRLRVALLTFGSPGHDAQGHVILQSELTEDLDLISERLFALRTAGGDEFVGRVMKTALDRLAWTREPALKVMFVAGNESADQDRIAPVQVQAVLARERGVVVNAIYCGGADDADARSWRQFAAQAGGRFANIDHNNGTVRIATPYDRALSDLSQSLNATYVFYGAGRKEARSRQIAQDLNAEAAAPAAAAERAVAKSGALYRPGADLVAALEREGFDLDKVAIEDLPEDMQAMTPAARRAHLERRAKARAEIAAKIQEVNRKRAAFIQQEMRRQRLDGTKSLDHALRTMIREQALRQGFQAPAAP